MSTEQEQIDLLLSVAGDAEVRAMKAEAEVAEMRAKWVELSVTLKAMNDITPNTGWLLTERVLDTIDRLSAPVDCVRVVVRKNERKTFLVDGKSMFRAEDLIGADYDDGDILYLVRAKEG